MQHFSILFTCFDNELPCLRHKWRPLSVQLDVLFLLWMEPPECFLFSLPVFHLCEPHNLSANATFFVSRGLEENVKPHSGHLHRVLVLSLWSQRSCMHLMQKQCRQGIVTGFLRIWLQITQQSPFVVAGIRGSAMSGERNSQ